MLRHIGGERQVTASDLRKKIDAENESFKIESEQNKIARANASNHHLKGNLSRYPAIKFWNFSALGPRTPTMINTQSMLMDAKENSQAAPGGVIYAPTQVFSPGIRSKSASRFISQSQANGGKSVQDFIRDNNSSSGFMTASKRAE